MPCNLERQDIRIGEACGNLVEPFKKVVNIAMQRVREGEVDSLNRQTVELFDEVENWQLKITDVPVKESSGMVESMGDLIAGLFIDVRQSKELISAIQLPREAGLVNKDTLYGLRRSNPKDVEKLAVSLLRSTRKQ